MAIGKCFESLSLKWVSDWYKTGTSHLVDAWVCDGLQQFKHYMYSNSVLDPPVEDHPIPCSLIVDGLWCLDRRGHIGLKCEFITFQN